ncbi:methylenetetrahydrofolate reductase [Haloactinopolyspora alba]|uniref:methylenetetrahydrofolate reductase n=1 Tax=Haloactinopolyspora alba TaxID=648780 RepID=UPI00197A7BED|nr:methylenetetrahydrofolate reductase [Haloactinopolyspora alba]
MTVSMPKVRGSRARRVSSPLPGEPRYEILPLPGVLDALAELPAGAAVTVTASPRHGVDATVELTERLAAQGLRAVPHLAARQIHDHTELALVVERLTAAGVLDVFVVGGDATEPAGEFPDGLALLRGLDALGRPFEHVGVPSYPEGHPLIDDDTLWTALADKEPYATYIVTQMCFDADTICDHAAEIRRRGITLPIVAGVPGVVDTAKLLRVSLRIGIGDSVRFIRKNRSTTVRLLDPRGFRPDALTRRLGEHVRAGRCDISGLHVYTFNHIGPTVRRMARLHSPETEVTGWSSPRTSRSPAARSSSR